MRSIQFVLTFTTTFIFLLTVGCKNEFQNQNVVEAENLLMADSSLANIQNLVRTIITEYEATNKKEEKINLLRKGIEVSEKYELRNELNSFQLGLITEDPSSKEAGEILFEMASSLKDRGKTEVADIMFKNIAENFSGLKSRAENAISDPAIEMDTIMLELGKSVFDNETGQVNKPVGLKYIDLCEAYALSGGNSEKALDYLFKGAEMARSMRSDRKALSLYDMILTRFPNSKKAATALFVKGFIFENTYRDLEKAKECYQDFIRYYPNDELIDDVQVLLDNLGKSDEEFFKNITEPNQ